ncbi:MAG TPA: sugar ABC transporter permease [Deltaproteobacteria bacterium]|nr:sugar ABC transporter permease [Deltaproteobacteria bacterium]
MILKDPGPSDRKSLTLSIFISPAVVLVILFYFVPVVLTLLIAFTDMDRTLRWNFIGFENFAKLFGLRGRDPFIAKIIKNTLVYIAGALPLTIGGGLFLSIFSMKINKSAGVFFRALFFIPRAIPPVVWGFLWVWAFEGTRYGLFNAIRTSLGLKIIHWFIKYPMLIVIMANGFLGVSLAMLVFSSAIASIPRDLMRAAEIDGATDWQITWHIIIPLLKWPILTMTAWHLMSFVNSYVYIMLITNGGPYYATEVWSLYAYHTAFNRYRYGYGASLITLLVIVNVTLLLIVLKIFGIKKMLSRGKIEV